MTTPAPPFDSSQKQRLTTINLDEIIWAMSDMLDLVGIDDFYHGKRVAYMTLECMRLHTGDEARLLTALDAALLHDCGVSSTEIHKKIIAELDWDQAHLHCERGHALLARHPLLSHLAPIVLYHHSRWSELVEREIPEETRLLANCLYLTDRVDALATGHSPDALLLNSRRIRETIAGYRGRLFSPQLVDTFLAISENEIFWLTLFSPHITYYLEELPIPGREHEIDFPMLRQTAALFADIVDAKSPFTAEHSLGVARLAVHLADLCGLDQSSREKLEIAGFLHDLGKLKVPDEILDKKGPLTVRERAVIIQHSFDTYQILRRIKGFETIARLAAFHHETLSGEGYPFHMQAAELAIESRIIAVADIFQALAQNRPYRASLPPEEIMALLHTLAREQKLDAELVALAGAHLESCWQVATGSQPDTTPARSR
ncbi:MAG: HD-GYP domain-containing protein [Thermodesulfobacteriota bacterium]